MMMTNFETHLHQQDEVKYFRAALVQLRETNIQSLAALVDTLSHEKKEFMEQLYQSGS